MASGETQFVELTIFRDVVQLHFLSIDIPSISTRFFKSFPIETLPQLNINSLFLPSRNLWQPFFIPFPCNTNFIPTITSEHRTVSVLHK